MDFDHIANLALKNYGKEFPSVEFFSNTTSVIYKVVDNNKQTYALKIYDHSSNIADNQVEILIAEAIRKKRTVSIPEIIKNKEGKNITIINDGLSNEPHRIVLSRWLEGINLKDNESKELFIQLGKSVAQLHLATKDIIIPKNLQPKQWNEVFYFRDEKPVYHDKKYNEIVNSEFKGLMDKAIPILNEGLRKIYDSSPPQLLHGDLNPWNIKIHENQISFLDFEDAILGQSIQDLAILLFYYKDHQKFPYSFVKEHILEGYSSIKPIEKIRDSDLEFLSIARTANFLNYVLTLDGDYEEFIKKGQEKLKMFLSSYTK